jgi:hypothetical protein
MDARWMRETPTDHSFDLTELKPDARRALRRSLKLQCALMSHYWDEPVQHFLTDLSPHGMWIDTLFPLHPGAEVVVSFTPPGGEEITLFARVRRAVTGRRRSDRGPLGMALAFTDASGEQIAAMDQRLRGIPPRLKRRVLH